MKIYLCWYSLLLIALMAGAGEPGSASPEADEAHVRLRNLGTMLKTRTAWTAAYSQEYIPSGMTIGEVVDGRVWVSWPDRALFATGDPTVRWMGLAGLDVRLLDLENQTCDDHLLTIEEWERIPLVAVLEPENAVDRFVVDVNGEMGLSLTARKQGGVERVTVDVGADGLPQVIVVHDPQGATSTFTFENWQPAEGPPEAKWLPAPPEGIECISDSD